MFCSLNILLKKKLKLCLEKMPRTSQSGVAHSEAQQPAIASTIAGMVSREGGEGGKMFFAFSLDKDRLVIFELFRRFLDLLISCSFQI